MPRRPRIPTTITLLQGVEALDLLIAVAGNAATLARLAGVPHYLISAWRIRGRVPYYGALLLSEIPELPFVLGRTLRVTRESFRTGPASYWARAQRSPAYTSAKARAAEYRASDAYARSNIHVLVTLRGPVHG